MASDLGEQASFYVNRTGRFTKAGVEIVESYLQIKTVQWKDEGFYRCRVDFFQAPTRNLKVKLSLRGNNAPSLQSMKLRIILIKFFLVHHRAA